MKTILIVILTCMCCALHAQEGIIKYRERVDLHSRMTEQMAQYKDMVPQFRTTNYDLFYKDELSLYKKSKAEEQPQAQGPQGRGMRSRMGAADRQVFKDTESMAMVDSREFMTKKFLIKGSVDEIPWKISDGQKQILDYVCLKATHTDSSDTYVAWFTPQISLPTGPDKFGGLPGVIMEVDINDGERTITATSVEQSEVEDELLKEPKKGKEVTSEEFRDIVREKMKEMRDQRRQGGQVIIRN